MYNIWRRRSDETVCSLFDEPADDVKIYIRPADVLHFSPRFRATRCGISGRLPVTGYRPGSTEDLELYTYYGLVSMASHCIILCNIGSIAQVSITNNYRRKKSLLFTNFGGEHLGCGSTLSFEPL